MHAHESVHTALLGVQETYEKYKKVISKYSNPGSDLMTYLEVTRHYMRAENKQQFCQVCAPCVVVREYGVRGRPSCPWTVVYCRPKHMKPACLGYKILCLFLQGCCKITWATTCTKRVQITNSHLLGCAAFCPGVASGVHGPHPELHKIDK